MWIEYHDTLKNNPKTETLARTLNIPIYAACGLLGNLWAWSVTNARGEDGSLAEYRESAISSASGWDGDPIKLYSALKEARFIDECDTIHNWRLYTGKLNERRKKDADRKRKKREEEKLKLRLLDASSGHIQETVRGATVTVTDTINLVTPTINKESTTSSSSGDARGLYAYFKSIFPSKRAPSFNIFKRC